MFRSRSMADLFPTPVWTFDLDVNERFNADLAAVINERAETVPTTSRGERTAWQSDNTFFDWCEAAAALRHFAFSAIRSFHPSLSAIDGMSLFGWANRLARGDYFSPHAHGGAAWSGVYWVDPGDASAEAGGLFCALDPRAGAHGVESPLVGFLPGTAAELPPKAGRMIIFPGWLQHWVTPYAGERPRLSVAFNAA